METSDALFASNNYPGVPKPTKSTSISVILLVKLDAGIDVWVPSFLQIWQVP